MIYSLFSNLFKSKPALDNRFLATNYELFKAYLMVQKGVSETWAQSCVGTIKRFVKQTGLKEPTLADAVSYILQFYQKEKSCSHIVNTCLGLEKYAEFLGQPFKLGRPRKPKRIVPKALTEAEITRMLTVCNLRQKAMLALLAYTGIRNSELCSLRLNEINFEDQTIFIKNGKGNQNGIVCIAPACLEVIKDYLKRYPRNNNETLFFTLAPNGKGRLKPNAVRKHIKKIALKAGIKSRVYPHLLRHSLAFNLLLHGGDLWTIKGQLRHAQIETTLIYVNSNTQVMKDRYQIFCPNYLGQKTKSLVGDRGIGPRTSYLSDKRSNH